MYYSPYLSRFLARYVNKAFAEVTGEKVNRGAGYRLEIPCVYHVYGQEKNVIKLKELTDSLQDIFTTIYNICIILGLSLFIRIDIKWVWLPVCCPLFWK